MKEWKRIPGYSLYEASTDGEIKTFNHYGKGKEAIMKPGKDKGGYLRTMIIGDDKQYHTVKVHRIIALTFIPNPENKPQVNHKNCIRHDNRLENLEWVTSSENMKHSYDVGSSDTKGSRNPAAQLKEHQVIEIRKNYVGGLGKNRETIRQIAGRYGVKYGVIKFIVQNKTWTHLLPTNPPSNRLRIRYQQTGT